MNKLFILLLLIPMVSFGEEKGTIKYIAPGGLEFSIKLDKSDIAFKYLKEGNETLVMDRVLRLVKESHGFNCNVQNNITPLPPLPNLPLMPCEDALEGMPCLKLP